MTKMSNVESCADSNVSQIDEQLALKWACDQGGTFEIKTGPDRTGDTLSSWIQGTIPAG